jgi:hypothetical protein
MQGVINDVKMSALKWSFRIMNDILEVPCDVLISSLGALGNLLRIYCYNYY